MNRRDFSTALLGSALISTGAVSACQGDAAHAVIGMPLPAIKGTYVDGAGFDLAMIKKPAIIRFWGMWCGPCMIDMPQWLSVVRQSRIGPKAVPNINIFTLHVGLAPSNGPSLAQWTSEQAPEVATPVVNDATQAITQAVGITGTPSTIFVDKDGHIREHAWQFKNERGVASFLRKITELNAKGLR
jgi:thiol-disulfide isomerase/thioredoxin